MLLFLTACSLFDRPEPALAKANEAWVAGDLAAFEELVDLDAVAPQALEGCVRLTALQGWSDRQFQPRTGWTELGQALGEGMVKGLVELSGPEVAQAAREDFGKKSMEEMCPALSLGDPSGMVVSPYEGGADVQIPVLVHGEGTVVVAKMQRLDSGWRVTGLSFDRAEEEYKAAQQARAAARAAELMDQLRAETSRSTWLELSAYAQNNPDDPVAAELEVLVKPLLDAETPVQVRDAWLQDRRLPGFRDAKVRVVNGSAMKARTVTVRFELQDGAGRPLRNVDGEDALQGTAALDLGPGDEGSFGVPGAGVLLFPDATQVVATPIRVTWEDGSVWTHPAVERGLWR